MSDPESLEHFSSRTLAEIGTFIDAETTAMEAEEQLAIMDDFWEKLDLSVPTLTPEQLSGLTLSAKHSPDKRIIPTPLLDLEGRMAIATRGRDVFSNQKFAYSAIWVPDAFWLHGKLLRRPGATAKEGERIYGFRYKIPDSDGLADRDGYVEKLIDGGKAVIDEKGLPWIYPITNIAPDTSSTGNKPSEQYEIVGPFLAPETLLAIRLLHQASGMTSAQGQIDFANEAIYRLDDEGSATALEWVTGVDWNPALGRVGLSSWTRDWNYGRDPRGVRDAESGL